MNIENKIEELMDLFTLEEILELSDLTELEAVTILFKAGHIILPPFMEEDDSYGGYTETEEQD